MQPNFVKPMLATLTEHYFSSDEWIYEPKLDGERCFVYKKNGKVTLKSRNDKIVNDTYPELVKALEAQPAYNFIIDGEIVAKNSNGISDFQILQGRLNVRNKLEVAQKSKQIEIYYYIFDLMYFNGQDIRDESLLDRKAKLKKLFKFNKILIYTDHIAKEGLDYFHKACKAGWEGIIAKKAESTYVGKRSTNWLKFKCVQEQELIICGFTNPKGSRKYFGALLVGYYDKNKKLIYAGKVGTGYSEEILKTLGTKLKKLVINKNPFYEYDGPIKDVNWVKPVLVGEFKFANWTTDNKLRVGRYKGLRDDKDAKEVVKEIPSYV